MGWGTRGWESLASNRACPAVPGLQKDLWVVFVAHSSDLVPLHSHKGLQELESSGPREGPAVPGKAQLTWAQGGASPVPQKPMRGFLLGGRELERAGVSCREGAAWALEAWEEGVGVCPGVSF